jgi:predicted branched-subunit amino acid permease
MGMRGLVGPFVGRIALMHLIGMKYAFFLAFIIIFISFFINGGE